MSGVARSQQPDLRLRLIALAWGFAEATLFFVVPDVLITLLALHGLRRGVVASGYALAGALLGGTVMWYWGAHDLAGARAALDHVPAIGTQLMDRSAAELASSGVVGMIIGPFVGVPYKIYAVHAATAHIPLGLFLLASIAARLPRFLLLAFAASHVGPWIERRYSRRATLYTWLVAWSVNYAIYWSIMPS